MIRGLAFSVGTALLVSACVPPASAPRAKALTPPAPLRMAGLLQPDFRGYRLAASYLGPGAFRDGAPLRPGALVDGLRVRASASSLVFADSVAEPPLLGGTQLPEQSSGGFLFWNSTALYTSDTFLGLLQPLSNIGFSPAAASFGPTFVLLRSAEGERVAVDLRSRERVAFNPPLLVDIASAADGRAVALLESGKCALSTDAGKTYQPLNLPAAEHALGVRSAGDTLLVQLSSGSVLRLESGKPPLLASPAPPPADRLRADALWPLAEPPLERALRFGVPLGEEFAGVAVAGSIATVNLRTGELVQMTRALVPSDLDCRALDANGSLLLVCASPTRGSIVISDVFGERPITQAQFPAGVHLAFANGVMLAAARCDGQVRFGAVCVRGLDGHWRDFDVSAKLAALTQAAPLNVAAGLAPLTVNRFIPKEGGGALAVVTGQVPGLLDVQSGVFLPLAPGVPYSVLNPELRSDAPLGLDWVALHDGSVRGWLPTSGVAITPDGRLQPSVYEFRDLVSAGAHALAFDKGRRAFQSSDWGHTWVETLAPPGWASGGVLAAKARCSDVGCHLGPWLRVGWEPGVPGALSRAQVAPAPSGALRVGLPILACKERAAPSVSKQILPEGVLGGATEPLAFGVAPRARDAEAILHGFFGRRRRYPFGDAEAMLGLRAGLVARLPQPPPEGDRPPQTSSHSAETKSFSFVAAFDPSARLRRASVTWRALSDVAKANGVPSPALDADDGAAQSALPVLGAEPGQADGLILDDGAPVWVQDAASPQPFSLGAGAEKRTIVSAVARAPHSLAVLVASADGTVDAREIVAGKAHRLFQIPSLGAKLHSANPDALALGPRGTLAVLRTRSGTEPATSADPVVLIDERGEPTALAPWSRLFLADAPECKAAPSDYRAVLRTSGAWLELVTGNATVDADATSAGMFALVRVNADRICLEALELAAGPAEWAGVQLPTHLAARFVGSGKGAARVGFDPGFELRQPLDCALSASH